VISNERLIRAIFKFEREGSRGVYELPTKGEVVDVLYVRDLPPQSFESLAPTDIIYAAFCLFFLTSSGKQEASTTKPFILLELEELATQAQGGISF
jgi:hypothetical protein